MASCDTSDQGMFIALSVYFFTSLAAGAIGGAFLLASRRAAAAADGSAPTSGSGGGGDKGSIVFGPDDYGGGDGGGPEGDGRESWQISISELRFGRLLGVGNVGEVFRGVFRGRPVAIKKLKGTWFRDDDMIGRFKEEIALLSQMNHPNVISFLGAVLDRDAGNICLVTELCERGTLEELLRSPTEPLSWLRRLQMARAIALGMDYLHARAGIIQRDLKAANLLVTRSYDVKIADFGLSRPLAPGTMKTYCGTPAYMAPEIVRQEDYSEMADVYSFGIIMWELLTRQEPYAGETSGLGLAYAVANEGLRPPIPAYCPREWASLMVRAWDAEPARRPTFDAIHRELFALIRAFETALAAPPAREPHRAKGGEDGGGGGGATGGGGAAASLKMATAATAAAGVASGPPRALPWVNPTGLVFVLPPPVATPPPAAEEAPR